MATDGFLGSMVKSTENRSNVLWNGGASFTGGWQNPIQDNENRKEGSKRVTWDELVYVRTIEPCPDKERGKWHHPDHKQRHRQGHHWAESKQTNFHNSITSPIYD